MAAKKKTMRAGARGLDAARIAEAALALIDADGLACLSARRLAASLQCEAMSLYHHVDGMEGVLDGVVDLVLSRLAARGRGHADPRKALAASARRFLTLAEAHPDAFRLVATRRWRTPGAIALAAQGAALLRELGLSPRAAMREVRVMGAYLSGAGLALAAWAEDARAPDKAVTAPLQSASNAAAVRADLMAGIDRLIASIAT